MSNQGKRKRTYEVPLAPTKEVQLERWLRNTNRTLGQERDLARLGNTQGIQHGVFADRFMSEGEREVFEGMMTRFYANYELNESADFVQLEFAGIYMLKLARAILAEDWEIAAKVDGLLRANLKDLKATKQMREGEKPLAPFSPAEWATELLERARERQHEEAMATDRNDGAGDETPE